MKSITYNGREFDIEDDSHDGDLILMCRDGKNDLCIEGGYTKLRDAAIPLFVYADGGDSEPEYDEDAVQDFVAREVEEFVYRNIGKATALLP